MELDVSWSGCLGSFARFRFADGLAGLGSFVHFRALARSAATGNGLGSFVDFPLISAARTAAARSGLTTAGAAAAIILPSTTTILPERRLTPRVAAIKWMETREKLYFDVR